MSDGHAGRMPALPGNHPPTVECRAELPPGGPHTVCMHSNRPSDNAPERRSLEGGAGVETPVQYYKIQDLVLLPELNPRAGLCEETIIRYMESFQALPPVNIQEGTGVLVDGFHRVEAARRLGVETIPVRML